MAFGRKPEEEIIKEETKVWECSSDECKCWLRDNFKSTEIPACPICESEMVESTRELQVLTNHSQVNKASS
ncbi:cold-inducible protein YdjO-related protein [Cytobacillus sp. S13-E01]|uniref:cold-inducible protein YdjO-related protein n=1 Tax=Cytobacillus sp. S13-E01 TaxID=3031326 RepID=UPI0023D85CF2|nr:cold-inducible protein YdjO-related protein [Cytobacillus sp. S13-E01]MDF0725622.1 cold-inducible protein YdjO-related protein [Cytobacillus sp. S13-E01]